MQLERLDRFARSHHGLITRAEAARSGIGKSAWYRAIRRGQLAAVHPNVARLYGFPTTRRQAILAAVLALTDVDEPPLVVLASHRSSAYLLGLDRPHRDPIDVTVTTGHARKLDGVVVHRTDDRRDLSPTWRDRIPCTNELRTLVDLGAVDAAAVSGALDHFAVTRRLRPTAIAHLLERHSRQGREGVVALRRALAAWPLGDDIPDSELEIAMADLLQNAGLPPARFHPIVAGFEVDFLIAGTPVVVECDGWSTHVAERDQWEFDLTRDAKLHAAGYVVLRRSRRQIVFEAAATARLIRQLIDRPSEPAT